MTPIFGLKSIGEYGSDSQLFGKSSIGDDAVTYAAMKLNLKDSNTEHMGQLFYNSAQK